MPLKEVAKHLDVTPQLIASWSNGVQRIPVKQLSVLSDFFQVDADLIRKELTVSDKVLIECQLEAQSLDNNLSDQASLYLAFKSLQKQFKESEQRVGYYQIQNQQLRRQLEDVRSALHL